MCGLFGFISRRGEGPDVERLQRIATETEIRGDHAFGLTWVDRRGRLFAYKRPGAATDNLDDLERCASAVVIAGHCRWATHGSPSDNRNNHPHRAGRGWLCHNGVIANHLELAAAYGLVTRTACDTEVLALLLAKNAGPLERRASAATRATRGPLAMLGVWANPARLLLVRRGNPLWYGEADEGGYFGSLSRALPDWPHEVPDDFSCVLSVRSGRVDRRACWVR